MYVVYDRLQNITFLCQVVSALGEEGAASHNLPSAANHTGTDLILIHNWLFIVVVFITLVIQFILLLQFKLLYHSFQLLFSKGVTQIQQ